MSRQELDTYPSQPAMVTELLKRVFISERLLVLEPAAGSGQLAIPLKQAGLQVVTNDIAYGSTLWICTFCGDEQWTVSLAPGTSDPFECERCGSSATPRSEYVYKEMYHTDHHRDASTKDLWHSIPNPDWVIGNPPFSKLDDILERSLAHSRIGVAFILRLTALEPACSRSKRGALLEAYADQLRYIMPFSGPRPSFTADGKADSVTTAWFVWMHGFSWENYVGIPSPFQFIMNWKAK